MRSDKKEAEIKSFFQLPGILPLQYAAAGDRKYYQNWVS